MLGPAACASGQVRNSRTISNSLMKIGLGGKTATLPAAFSKCQRVSPARHRRNHPGELASSSLIRRLPVSTSTTRNPATSQPDRKLGNTQRQRCHTVDSTQHNERHSRRQNVQNKHDSAPNAEVTLQSRPRQPCGRVSGRLTA